MFLKSFHINPSLTVSEIVALDYRTANVFKKYGIGYCCSERWPLDKACLIQGIEMQTLLPELYKATRSIQLPSTLLFEKWSIDFLTNYIINIHHHYLEQTLPELAASLHHFSEEHKNLPQYREVKILLEKLKSELLPHIRYEEEVIFPYTCQVAHAYESKDTLARLLVKTLRKPLAGLIDQEHEMLRNTLGKLRELTGNYTQPVKACTSHMVILSRLKELDNDLSQHIYLENEILFTRVIAMEKELLSGKN
jgi:regulator of cell morphogenesis and NO signaling